MNNFSFVKKIIIDKKNISHKSNTYVVAEAGVAHFGNLKKAFRLVDLAKNAGADAVKFQAYITDELIFNKFKSWYNRYKLKEIDYTFLYKLKKYCKKKKITFLFTPHSETAIKWAKKLRIPAIKVGSGEIGNFNFLNKLVNLKKPIIVSTGMHSEKDLKDLRNFFKNKNFKKVIFLRCVTSYPTKINELNLRNISKFKKIFKNAIIGYSDHTNSDLAIHFAVSNGAKLIEKHISLDFNVKNAQDWKVSHDEIRMKNLIKNIRNLEIIGGKLNITPSKKELSNKIWATKSLFYKNRFNKGQVLTEDMICAKRPGTGIKCSELKKYLGKKLNKNTPIRMIKKSDFK